MTPRRLYIVAVNNRYGDNVFLPLVAGLLWAYARKQPGLAAAWTVPPGGLLYLKEPTAQALARIEDPDLVVFSSYIWNAAWNRALARAVKARYPRCTTLIGGIEVRAGSPAALEAAPEFDLAIYGEGEGALADALCALAGAARPDLGAVPSLIWRRADGEVVVNPRRAEVPIESLPSPYLDGVFDELAAGAPWRWQALQETNRGCPYSCTFCAWGNASLAKLRKFPTERVVDEFEWMATHGVDLLYNCDANFGILPRDVDLAEALIRTKERHGRPVQFRAAYAKNSDEKVFALSQRLAGAGMLKATTLALQSMDGGVLTLIKRKNIRQTRLAELSARYEAAGIPTYAEIIVGLPGESKESFLAGLDALLDLGQHDGVTVYLCMLLENTELATEESRRAHGIESAPLRAILYHGTPEPGAVEEIQETVIGTRAMPRADLRAAVLYAWLLQALHALGLTQDLARWMHGEGVRYRDLYCALLAWAEVAPGTVLGREVGRLAAAWDAALAGAPWALVDPRFGALMWPPEELLFLRIACEAPRFYAELRAFLDTPLWPAGTAAALDEQQARFRPPPPGEEETYAREAVWYGRKGPGARLRRREKGSAA